MKTIAVIRLVKMLKIQHMETGAEARKARQARFISLRAMARRLKISAPYLSDLELGKRNWTMKKIRAFEAALEQKRKVRGFLGSTPDGGIDDADRDQS
jgi:transcriptional regulator with XRE-family HTH domain